MAIDIAELRALPPEEKLRLVELLWDDLEAEEALLPLPAWVEAEAHRRVTELGANPDLGLTHQEIWHRLESSRG
jgi:putative addiction module component (TIGR02574 family)